MIITTSSAMAGYRIVETKGLVRASTIRARHLGKDIMAFLRSLVGGEIKEYTTMMAEIERRSYRANEGECCHRCSIYNFNDSL